MPLQTIMTAANTVSRARPALSAAAADHHGDDQRHLDDRDRDGQHERAERFADAVRDDLGVIDRREHGRDQHDAGNDGKHGDETERDGDRQDAHAARGQPHAHQGIPDR